MRPLPLRRALGLAVLLLALAAAPARATETVVVELTAEGFEPAEVTVPVGGTVVWHNESAATHTVVADDASWDTGPVEPGDTFSVRMRNAGEFGYATSDGVFEALIVVTAVEEPDEEPVGDPAEERAEDPEPEGDPDESLADTGDDLLVLLGAALVLLGAGSLLVRTQRP